MLRTVAYVCATLISCAIETNACYMIRILILWPTECLLYVYVCIRCACVVEQSVIVWLRFSLSWFNEQWFVLCVYAIICFHVYKCVSKGFSVFGYISIWETVTCLSLYAFLLLNACYVYGLCLLYDAFYNNKVSSVCCYMLFAVCACLPKRCYLCLLVSMTMCPHMCVLLFYVLCLIWKQCVCLFCLRYVHQECCYSCLRCLDVHVHTGLIHVSQFLWITRCCFRCVSLCVFVLLISVFLLYYVCCIVLCIVINIRLKQICVYICRCCLNAPLV